MKSRSVLQRDPIGLKISPNGFEGVLSTAEGATKVHARLSIQGAWSRVPFLSKRTLPDHPLEIAWRPKRIGPHWLSLQATLINRGDRPLTLGSFHLLEGAELPKPRKDSVVLVDSGGGWFAGAVRATASGPPYDEKWSVFIAPEDVSWVREVMGGKLEHGAHHSLAGILAYYRGPSLPTWILSFLVPLQRCAAMPLLLMDPGTGRVRAFALVNDFAGYELAAGARISTETVLLGSFDDPHEALENWAATCARLRRVRCWPKPPVGWLSWYGYRLTQNEKDTLRTVDLIKERLDGLGFRYMQLDLGYNRGNLPGEWFEPNDHYPHGLKHLAKEFAKRGFALGVWSCPFLVAADSAFAREHPEALVQGADGRPLDQGAWFWEPHGRLYLVDPTHPAGAAFLVRMIRYFKAQGVTYFKFDFTNRLGTTDRNFIFHDRNKIRGIEVYRHGLKVVTKALDPTDYVYWCSNLVHFGIGLGATSMTACDIGNTGFSQARRVEGRTEDLRYFRQQATTVLSRYYLHNQLLLINADSINLAPPADMEECRLRATLVAMSGGQVFLGDRFDLCEEDRFELIRQVLPPYGKAARPVDLFEKVDPESYPQIWHLTVNTGWDRRDVIALVNLDRDQTIEVNLRRLGLPAGVNYHLWEFWEQHYLGRTDDGFRLVLKCPSTRLVAIVPERKHPWVLSTSFHFTQGAVELAEVRWNQRRRVLSGVLLRPKGIQGEIYVVAPETCRCSLEPVAPGVFRLPLVSKGPKTKWSVPFTSLP